MMIRKRSIYLFIIFIILILGASVIWFTRIGTGRYCFESPEVRWRLAIYLGECDDVSGCHYRKRPGTGVLEYFGLRDAPSEGCTSR